MKSYAVRILGALVVSTLLLGALFVYLGRFSTYPRAFDLASGALDFVGTFQAKPQVREAELLAFAQTPVSPEEYWGGDASLGFLDGTEVILGYPCSDLCPNYMVRVIRLEVPVTRTCSQVGGVFREVNVGGFDTRYCFPRILIDNWDVYRRTLIQR